MTLAVKFPLSVATVILEYPFPGVPETVGGAGAAGLVVGFKVGLTVGCGVGVEVGVGVGVGVAVGVGLGVGSEIAACALGLLGLNIGDTFADITAMLNPVISKSNTTGTTPFWFNKRRFMGSNCG